jgi:SAM-dependent methyltransferase
MIQAALDGPGQAPPIEPATLDAVFGRVAAYYGAKLARHGATPQGVDWSCAATQWLRFVQLLKLCAFDAPFSLIDVGCGYGALAAFLRARHPGARVDYLGIDLSAAMVRCARRRHRGRPATRFQAGRNCPHQADYAVASGIMNVTLGCPRPLWEDGVGATLIDLRRLGRRGFAVNFLAAAPEGSPPEMLYCAEPARWAGFCRAELGCGVEVLDGYGMREFTLLARY